MLIWFILDQFKLKNSQVAELVDAKINPQGLYCVKDVSGFYAEFAKRWLYDCNRKWKRKPQMAYRFESCSDYLKLKIHDEVHYHLLCNWICCQFVSYMVLSLF